MKRKRYEWSWDACVEQMRAENLKLKNRPHRTAYQNQVRQAEFEKRYVPTGKDIPKVGLLIGNFTPPVELLIKGIRAANLEKLHTFEFDGVPTTDLDLPVLSKEMTDILVDAGITTEKHILTEESLPKLKDELVSTILSIGPCIPLFCRATLRTDLKLTTRWFENYSPHHIRFDQTPNNMTTYLAQLGCELCDWHYWDSYSAQFVCTYHFVNDSVVKPISSKLGFCPRNTHNNMVFKQERNYG